jgi:phosphinothricin acetyltransferase
MLVRVAEERDAEEIAAIYAPIVASTPISFELEPPSADELRRRIRETLTRYPWLVADDGGVLGYAYATQHRSRAAYRFAVDVSVYVAERAHRRGVGRALYTKLFALLEQQGFVAAHAGIALPNEASVALHESVGFERVGIYPRVGFKFGKWIDTAWVQRPLSPRHAAPTEPVPFSELP